MRPNLDSLTEEIQHYLETEHFVLYRAMSRATDDGQFVYWDVEKQQDYKFFLECAQHLGVRLIHFHTREFCHHHREEALEVLGECNLPREEARDLQHRIEELSIYEGFTCAVELTFDFEGRIYLFELQTDWYDEWHDILDELEEASPEDPEQPGGFPGLYSNN